MARMCCSNCEVTAPSIVQWPLLCTRGAISLTSGPSAAGEELDGQHADVAERLGDAQRRVARLVDLRGDRIAAGHRRTAQDSVAMDVLGRIPEVRGGRRPSARRSPRIRRRSRPPLRRRPAPRRSPPRRLRCRPPSGPRPGPCRHSRSGGSSAPAACRARRPRRAHRRGFDRAPAARRGRRSPR